MKVSILMAIYNGEKYVTKAIESILNQTFKDFEFIIINDGSTDNTQYFLDLYSQKDKRIKVIKNKKNIGLTKSLNKAIKLAKGKYIARQDVDDLSLPKRIEKQFNFLEKFPDYSFCGTNVIIKQNKNFSLKYFTYNEMVKHLIIKNIFYHSSIFLRKEIFDKYGKYNEKWRYAQDYELWCRYIYRYKLKARNLNEKLVIMNIPNTKFIKKNNKFIIQRKNCIITRLLYLKYVENVYSIIMSLIYILIDFFKIIFVIFYRIFLKFIF
ncbi:MAG: glycosyltransferase family 2 protein [Promethearchaeota archaeon]